MMVHNWSIFSDSLLLYGNQASVPWGFQRYRTSTGNQRRSDVPLDSYVVRPTSRECAIGGQQEDDLATTHRLKHNIYEAATLL